MYSNSKQFKKPTMNLKQFKTKLLLSPIPQINLDKTKKEITTEDLQSPTSITADFNLNSKHLEPLFCESNEEYFEEAEYCITRVMDIKRPKAIRLNTPTSKEFTNNSAESKPFNSIASNFVEIERTNSKITDCDSRSSTSSSSSSSISIYEDQEFELFLSNNKVRQLYTSCKNSRSSFTAKILLERNNGSIKNER